jgi:gas vesicle protein
MRWNEGSRGTGFALGVLTGVVVGAGVTFLFAPKAGRDLRQDPGESMDDLRAALANRYRDLATSPDDELERIEASVEQLFDELEAAKQDSVHSVTRPQRLLHS